MSKIEEIEEMQKKIDELQKELDELKEQEKGGRWKPEVGEIYYLVNTDGSVVKTTNKGTCFDEDTIALGNKFNTKERCEFVAEKLKVMEELRQFAEPEDREWDGERKHWNIGYDYLDELQKELDELKERGKKRQRKLLKRWANRELRNFIWR